MFKIETDEELKKLLKLITEEAVTEAIYAEDPAAKNFKKADGQNILGEQEEVPEEEEEVPEEEEEVPEEEAPEEETPDTEPTQDAETADEEDSEKINPAAEKALSFIADYEEGIDASFQNIITALNILRAGKSTKNKDIKSELNNYYERLTIEERQVLLLYLNELAKLLTGALDGDEAQDPSDPKTYFDISIRPESPNQPGAKESSKKAPEADQIGKMASTAVDVKNQQPGKEDTSPPIKVNEVQDLSLLREKIRTLMRS